MHEDSYQLIGLIGFIIAGFMFIAVGVRFEDNLTIWASVVWIVSCVIWMIPLVRRRK